MPFIDAERSYGENLCKIWITFKALFILYLDPHSQMCQNLANLSKMIISAWNLWMRMPKNEAQKLLQTKATSNM